MSILDYARDVFENPDVYRKFWVAAAGFLLTLLSNYFPDALWLQPLIAAITAGGVISVPNKKGL